MYSLSKEKSLPLEMEVIDFCGKQYGNQMSESEALNSANLQTLQNAEFEENRNFDFEPSALGNGLFDEVNEDSNDQENYDEIDINSDKDENADGNTPLNISFQRGRKRLPECQAKCKSKVERSKPTRMEFDWKSEKFESRVSPHANAFTVPTELLQPIDYFKIFFDESIFELIVRETISVHMYLKRFNCN
ncbi:hypothetical protein HHI36_002839 [Cryptolaemus montrouzieri]|uniref:PiggyBac transposable element-derived protein domain-containing protein n=1 Tax=Cryptolaemus montrouzieri TaxID=559131 RepID=A0ABD2PBN7_9CUCU